jgi:thiamine pyrophosphokinase
MKDEKKHVLLLLDGEEPSKAFLEHFLSNATVVVATDGAAKYAHSHNIPLDMIIGDMDSLPLALKKIFEAKKTRIIEESEQKSNDFEKALRLILSESLGRDIIVLGIHGKRTDHLLTNFSVMLRFTNSFDSLVAYDVTHEHHFLTAENHWYSFDYPVGTLVSLTPLPESRGVTTSGFYYPLKSARMVFGEREGLDNIISSDGATVEISKGALLISIPITDFTAQK